MQSFNPQRRRSWKKTGLAATGVAFSAVLLAGCSSIPNSVNPVHWYDSVASWVSPGDDSGDNADTGGDAAAAANSEGALPSGGLSSDRSNAHYSQAVASREGTPTRPLNPDAAVARNNAAPSGVVPPAPAVQTADAAPPPPSSPYASRPPYGSAPQTAYAAPPQSLRPGPAGNETVEEVYQRRLSEFDRLPVRQPNVGFQPSQQSYNRPAMAAAQAPTPYAQPSYTYGNGTLQGGVQLTPPGHHGRSAVASRSNASGSRSLADFNEGRSSASFDLATVSFGEGTSELSSADHARLRDVASLLRKKGGTLRVIAASASQRLDVDPRTNMESNRALARARADAIASELIRLGVPARKIYAGAADDVAQASVADGAEILLDM